MAKNGETLDLMALAGIRNDLDDLRARAQAGDPVAQFNMGVKYAEGSEVPQDYQEAARWYSAAADQNDAPAQFNLGLLFYQGQGLRKDLSCAYELFSLAAAQGDTRAHAGMTAILGEVPTELAEELIKNFGQGDQGAASH
ncbi:sel1 repeat family protein [Acidithiobacillus thiooxidans]|uniref:tetratricopeptide repeat protein n=1 Tax=Acidithiobacillus TaxID=119977 RepID=UPI00187966E2|nr:MULTISPECIES: tetratricopeptide repeat protein [Acidithiobacillus]MBE7567220.1 sel1 repeat family protein [Acidithiobacillus sp. HP-11]MBU2751410.1 sel1 repeat family protein [Acidithiobacillus thiooxidans]MBU2794974.1 sel1 repeat family protein [Acidithiobacillus thiooxidans]MBU2835359.1 sel1 repeat family protein [Acidithiobacillus thiooxidans]